VVSQIGAISKAEAMRNALSMRNTDGKNFNSGDLNGRVIKDIDCKTGAAGLGRTTIKCVLESPSDSDECLGGYVDRNISFLYKVEGADIIKTENVIGVGVGEDNRIETINVRAQGLIAEIGRAVN
jgi:hypothetical protein